MNPILLALYALPPIGYAAVYAVYCFKRVKTIAAIGVIILSLLALFCFILLAYNA